MEGLNIREAGLNKRKAGLPCHDFMVDSIWVLMVDSIWAFMVDSIWAFMVGKIKFGSLGYTGIAFFVFLITL